MTLTLYVYFLAENKVLKRDHNEEELTHLCSLSIVVTGSSSDIVRLRGLS